MSARGVVELAGDVVGSREHVAAVAEEARDVEWVGAGEGDGGVGDGALDVSFDAGALCFAPGYLHGC